MNGSRTFLAASCLFTAVFAAGSAVAATMLEDLTVPADFSVDTGAPPKLAIRTSPQNLPIYVFGGDAPGKSNCNAGCIGAWSPVLAGGGASPLGDWTIITRDDQRRQWAYKGQPLYTFFTDEPGKPTGDGQDDGKWRLFQP